MPGNAKRRDDGGHAGGDDDGDDFDSDGGDDDSEGSSGGSDDGDEDGEQSALDKRRMTRAAGHHPLQSTLRYFGKVTLFQFHACMSSCMQF